jgi:hypothetical protein
MVIEEVLSWLLGLPFILPQSLTRPGIPQAPTVWLGGHKYTILHAIYRVSLAEWVAGGRVSRERENVLSLVRDGHAA